MNRLRKGDQVRITRGSLKGKEGKIKEILVSEGRATIEGVGSYKRYKKGRGMVEQLRTIHVSNLALLTNDKKKTEYKVSYVIKEGKKERVKRESPKDKEKN